MQTALVLSLLALPLAGCADLDRRGGNVDALPASDARVDGVALYERPMIEGRFSDDADWNSTPVLDLRFPTLVLQKPPPPPTGGDGVRKNLDFTAADNPLQVRLQGAAQFQGFTALWSRRPARADWSVPCAQTTLNEAIAAPADAEARFPVTMPGTLVLQARIVDEAGRDVALFCKPLVAIVNAHWSVNGSIQPIGATAGTQGSAAKTPDYEKMADTFTFGVGDEPTVIGKKSYLGQIKAKLRLHGPLGLGNGLGPDLALVWPYDYATCDSFWWARTLLTGSTAFSDRYVGAFVQDGRDAGQWKVQVGAADRCSSVLDWVKAYASVSPISYSLDVELAFA